MSRAGIFSSLCFFIFARTRKNVLWSFIVTLFGSLNFHNFPGKPPFLTPRSLINVINAPNVRHVSARETRRSERVVFGLFLTLSEWLTNISRLQSWLCVPVLGWILEIPRLNLVKVIRFVLNGFPFSGGENAVG